MKGAQALATSSALIRRAFKNISIFLPTTFFVAYRRSCSLIPHHPPECTNTSGYTVPFLSTYLLHTIQLILFFPPVSIWHSAFLCICLYRAAPGSFIFWLLSVDTQSPLFKDAIGVITAREKIAWNLRLPSETYLPSAALFLVNSDMDLSRKEFS